MELKVYNGEYFERGKTRYIVFVLFILAIIAVSVLYKNFIGGILVFLVAGGYIFYETKSNDVVNMVIGKKAIQVGKTIFPRESLEGFVLEYHTKKKRIHNIVLIEKKNNPRIYTIKDSKNEEYLKDFINELNGHIPMLDKYDQSTFDRFIRKIKL